MPQGVRFTGAYEVSALPALIPGSWYIGFACKKCRQHFAISDRADRHGRFGDIRARDVQRDVSELRHARRIFGD